MGTTLTTSKGEIFRNTTVAELNRVFGQLAPATRIGARGVAERTLEFIYLADAAGNELTLTAQGSLRLYFADSRENNLSLVLGRVEVGSAGRELCAQFLTGDMDGVRGQPWERNRTVDARDFPVAGPLPGAESAGVVGLAGETVEALVAEGLGDGSLEKEAGPCPRCGKVMAAGYLTTRMGRAHVPVHWGRGGIKQVGWTKYIDRPEELLPVVAMRCAGCGWVEFRA